ncbi:Crp/Fnr family transcriptional regulator [Streptomyces hainanensis]|uniref:Crp/Fnr family transcriptional regulator n=1 Tax=Streptomyces hainanensis TaxID=402648 RepID=A0A4R4T0M3_9ACTN|nr:Crp/Fnr family transcriptional regulator [Streptomyces hainanensis]TDC69176.1 Crp/Fnr family transcriptional regulator [Streptomyces hainanensis]
MTFWSLLGRPARQSLARVGERAVFAGGATLLKEHDVTDHLLVVERGCVKVTASTSEGYEAVLALRGAGDLLGEQAGADGRPRSASVVALTHVRALTLPLRAFESLVRADPSIGRAVRQVQSERLRQADRRGVVAGGEDTSRRLAALLLDLGHRYGRPESAGGVEIVLPLSQDDLAGLVLSSRRTVSRILEQWRAQGWLTTGRLRLVIHEPDALKHEAGDGPA